MSLKIGDTIYNYQHNARDYRDAAGSKTNEVYWPSQWRAETIVGETTRSWIVGHQDIPRLQEKIAKSQVNKPGFYTPCTTREEIERRYPLILKSRQIDKAFQEAGIETRRTIAEMLGVDLTPHPVRLYGEAYHK